MANIDRTEQEQQARYEGCAVKLPMVPLNHVRNEVYAMLKQVLKDQNAPGDSAGAILGQMDALLCAWEAGK